MRFGGFFSNWVPGFHQIINPDNLYASYSLKCFFDLAYCIGLCPFRLVIKHTESLKTIVLIQQWRPQKIYCVFSTCLCLSWLVRELCSPLGLKSSTKQESKHPKHIFGFLLKLLMFSIKVVTIKNFWLDQEMFLKVTSHLLRKDILHSSKTRHGEKYASKHCFIITICCTNILYNVAALFEIVTRPKMYGLTTGDDENIWTFWYHTFLVQMETLTSVTTKNQVERFLNWIDMICWAYR